MLVRALVFFPPLFVPIEMDPVTNSVVVIGNDENENGEHNFAFSGLCGFFRYKSRVAPYQYLDFYLIAWDSGERTWEPFENFNSDDAIHILHDFNACFAIMARQAGGSRWKPLNVFANSAVPTFFEQRYPGFNEQFLEATSHTNIALRCKSAPDTFLVSLDSLRCASDVHFDMLKPCIDHSKVEEIMVVSKTNRWDSFVLWNTVFAPHYGYSFYWNGKDLGLPFDSVQSSLKRRIYRSSEFRFFKTFLRLFAQLIKQKECVSFVEKLIWVPESGDFLFCVNASCCVVDHVPCNGSIFEQSIASDIGNVPEIACDSFNWSAIYSHLQSLCSSDEQFDNILNDIVELQKSKDDEQDGLSNSVPCVGERQDYGNNDGVVASGFVTPQRPIQEGSSTPFDLKQLATEFLQQYPRFSMLNNESTFLFHAKDGVNRLHVRCSYCNASIPVSAPLSATNIPFFICTFYKKHLALECATPLHDTPSTTALDVGSVRVISNITPSASILSCSNVGGVVVAGGGDDVMMIASDEIDSIGNDNWIDGDNNVDDGNILIEDYIRQQESNREHTLDMIVTLRQSLGICLDKDSSFLNKFHLLIGNISRISGTFRIVGQCVRCSTVISLTSDLSESEFPFMESTATQFYSNLMRHFKNCCETGAAYGAAVVGRKRVSADSFIAEAGLQQSGLYQDIERVFDYFWSIALQTYIVTVLKEGRRFHDPNKSVTQSMLINHRKAAEKFPLILKAIQKFNTAELLPFDFLRFEVFVTSMGGGGGGARTAFDLAGNARTLLAQNVERFMNAKFRLEVKMVMFSVPKINGNQSANMGNAFFDCLWQSMIAFYSKRKKGMSSQGLSDTNRGSTVLAYCYHFLYVLHTLIPTNHLTHNSVDYLFVKKALTMQNTLASESVKVGGQREAQRASQDLNFSAAMEIWHPKLTAHYEATVEKYYAMVDDLTTSLLVKFDMHYGQSNVADFNNGITALGLDLLQSTAFLETFCHTGSVKMKEYCTSVDMESTVLGDFVTVVCVSYGTAVRKQIFNDSTYGCSIRSLFGNPVYHRAAACFSFNAGSVVLLNFVNDKVNITKDSSLSEHLCPSARCPFSIFALRLAMIRTFGTFRLKQNKRKASNATLFTIDSNPLETRKLMFNLVPKERKTKKKIISTKRVKKRLRVVDDDDDNDDDGDDGDDGDDNDDHDDDDEDDDDGIIIDDDDFLQLDLEDMNDEISFDHKRSSEQMSLISKGGNSLDSVPKVPSFLCVTAKKTFDWTNVEFKLTKHSEHFKKINTYFINNGFPLPTGITNFVLLRKAFTQSFHLSDPLNEGALAKKTRHSLVVYHQYYKDFKVVSSETRSRNHLEKITPIMEWNFESARSLKIDLIYYWSEILFCYALLQEQSYQAKDTNQVRVAKQNTLEHLRLNMCHFFEISNQLRKMNQ